MNNFLYVDDLKSYAANDKTTRNTPTDNTRKFKIRKMTQKQA